jgi:pimeloyl-ACP methyl ester carboxylesterase
VRAKWITPQDPIIITADGGRLPTVPLSEAIKLDELREEMGLDNELDDNFTEKELEQMSQSQHGSEHSETRSPNGKPTIQKSAEGSLRKARPPARTNPLFPPLPLYGPPTIWRDIQCMTFRFTSFFLSLAFLAVIVLGSLFTSIPLLAHHIWQRLQLKNADERRPFYKEELKRQEEREAAQRTWQKKQRRARSRRRGSDSKREPTPDEEKSGEEYSPTEGGPDPLVCDIAYYARRVGLDAEEFAVETEDGFIISLYHIYNPSEYIPLPASELLPQGPDVFSLPKPDRSAQYKTGSKRKYPILMIHGLLQSAGAYCVNDEASLAFWLCKQGYDIFLGSNRCGFAPRHTKLRYSDPRMWAWNIRAMGILDLPALISRVLAETGFEKLALVAHSQGTTETFVALAKGQRPELGERISVFCALAPAAYAGPLIGKMYFKFMRVISPSMFRLFFGIHAFIPFMMTMHRLLPGKVYGWLGYRVFSFLFGWTDTRWERGLRDRFFQFAPVYVSAEAMRWWLGRECFATQKCILATRDEVRSEEEEDGQLSGTGTGYPGHDCRDRDRDRDGEQEPGEGPKGDKGEYFEKAKEDTAKYPEGAFGAEGAEGLHHQSAPDAREQIARTAAHSSPSPPLESQADHPLGQHGMSRSSHTDKPTRKPSKRGSTAWYPRSTPPLALWICGSDDLVDGRRLLRRFKRGREPNVRLVHASVIEEYEHLDVIWAIDAIEKVGREVRDVVWRCVPADVRNGESGGEKGLVVPEGCGDVGPLAHPLVARVEGLNGGVVARERGGEEQRRDGDGDAADAREDDSSSEESSTEDAPAPAPVMRGRPTRRRGYTVAPPPAPSPPQAKTGARRGRIRRFWTS